MKEELELELRKSVLIAVDMEIVMEKEKTSEVKSAQSTCWRTISYQ
jgi:hypothetical protein